MEENTLNPKTHEHTVIQGSVEWRKKLRGMECSRKKEKLEEGGTLDWRQYKNNDKSGSGGGGEERTIFK